MPSMSREKFLEVTARTAWATIDDFVTALDAAGYWSEDFFDEVVEREKKVHIRHMLGHLKGDDNWPIFGNVITTTTDGKQVRVYKQETMFDLDDYYQQTNYHFGRVRYHMKMALGWRERGEKRYGIQIPLPLDEIMQPDPEPA